MTRAGIYWFWPDPVAEIAGLEKNSIYDSTKPVCATVPTEVFRPSGSLPTARQWPGGQQDPVSLRGGAEGNFGSARARWILPLELA